MKEWSDAARPRTRPGLAEREIDGETLIVNAEGGEILVLNESGSLVWSRLDGEHDVAALVALVQEGFEVDAGTARADVCEFLTRLAERGALEPE